ncbi:hypothetical protein ASAP_0728 [Asaia bogorensis]|uniref:Uncharacterized protein n=1 Tax=Asaia bogorensis TaxID=91915 RepID=A0A060QDL7_9PROT|nr:hypothetical protein ASAP_0728 [Asaia bogorensis]
MCDWLRIQIKQAVNCAASDRHAWERPAKAHTQARLLRTHHAFLGG